MGTSTKRELKNILIEELNNADISNQYNSFNLSNKDLYEIAKWGLIGEYSDSGCWDDSDDINSAIECAIEDFKQFLSIPYPKELGNVPKELTIYRFVTLEDENKLDKYNLGESWFSNKEQPKEYPNFFDMLDYLTKNRKINHKLYLLTGKTNITNVDVVRTLWERSTQWAENEIVVKNPSIVKLDKIEKYLK